MLQVVRRPETKLKQVIHFAMVKLRAQEHCSAAECEEATPSTLAAAAVGTGLNRKLAPRS